MEKFEAMILASIDTYGFRISPRLEFGDRLARFIEQYYALQGRVISREEAEVCSSMLLLRFSMDTKREPRTRAEHSLHSFIAETNTSLNSSKHSMKLRSSNTT
jgi:hypothetical protein